MYKALDLLGLRLVEIEQRLYGHPSDIQHVDDSSGEHSAWGNLNLLKTLHEIDNKLKALTFNKDRFNQCYNELKRLEKWLGEDDHFDNLLSTFGSQAPVVRFEEVLAFEDEILADSERISELERILPCLEQPHLSRLDQLEPQLIRLKLDLLNLQQNAKRLDQETKDLIENFNIWYQGILEKLKLLNEDLTDIERQQEEMKYNV